jgi:Cu+-exporting ATPase
MAEFGELRLKIDGMHCAGCAANIEKGLMALDGIKGAQVNYALGTARIDFEPIRVNEKSIYETITALGYHPQNAATARDRSSEELRTARLNFISALIFAFPAIALSMVTMLLKPHLINHRVEGIILFIFTMPVLFYSGREIIADAWLQTIHFRANMNSLIALGSLTAFLYSTYVLADILFIGAITEINFYFETAAAIVTLILLGRFLESRAKGKARDAIGALMKLRPDKATAIVDNGEMEIYPADIKPGMIIMVKAGEKIPADGQIISGEPSINEAMLTGESLPAEKKIGDKVIGGSINGNTVFRFEVTGAGEDTFLAGIIRLVTEAQDKKAPVQRLADRIAGVFVPIVLLTAIATFIVWFLVAPGNAMMLKAPVAVLIIACPCALGLATPTAILAGTGRAARRGIYIRGGDILENTVKADHIIFDKTGTLTEGRFEVVSFKSDEGIDDRFLWEMAAAAESGSSHPLALAIVDKARSQDVEFTPVEDLTEYPGFGIKAKVNEHIVVIGNNGTMEKENIDIESLLESAGKEMDKGRTVVFAAADGALLGYFALADRIREEAPEVINNILKGGREVVMLTGDNYKTARGVAASLGIKKFEAAIGPEQKTTIIETYRRAGKKVIMVGDGINDAPALAAADIGVAVGSGTDVAMESADIILVRNNLNALLEALKISAMTFKTIKQNLFWAFFYNVIAIPIAAGVLYPLLGMGLSPVIAAAAMSFSSVFVVSNSLRLLR